VKATCYVGVIDQRDQFLVRTALVIAVAFSKVHIYVYFFIDGRHGGVVVVVVEGFVVLGR
jgi:hypothetical protein